MKHKKIKIILGLLALCSLAILFSYETAKIKADRIMKYPLEKGNIGHYKTSFQPISFLIDNDIILDWWGPSWWISYDHKTELMTGPVSIRVNLFGKITSTNPTNLREIILKHTKDKNPQLVLVQKYNPSLQRTASGEPLTPSASLGGP